MVEVVGWLNRMWLIVADRFERLNQYTVAELWIQTHFGHWMISSGYLTVHVNIH